MAANHFIPSLPKITIPFRAAAFLPVLLFWAVIFSSIPFHNAYAASCIYPPLLFEAMFKQSSFVFTGIAEREGRSPVPFRLTHVYKTPKGGLPKKAQVQVSFPEPPPFLGLVEGAQEDHFDFGKEYLIFGYGTTVNGSVVRTLTPACGTRWSAGTLIADLRAKKKNPALFSERDPPLIFIGRVKQVRQWRDLRQPPPPPKSLAIDVYNAEELGRRVQLWRDAKQTSHESGEIVDFKIEELIRNVPLQDKPYHQVHKSQHVKIFTCRNAYHIGHRYLMFAEPGVPQQLAGAPKLDKVNYSHRCNVGDGIDLKEKTILAQLSRRKHKGHKP